jgi:hypothetical protein
MSPTKIQLKTKRTKRKKPSRKTSVGGHLPGTPTITAPPPKKKPKPKPKGKSNPKVKPIPKKRKKAALQKHNPNEK